MDWKPRNKRELSWLIVLLLVLPAIHLFEFTLEAGRQAGWWHPQPAKSFYYSATDNIAAWAWSTALYEAENGVTVVFKKYPLDQYAIVDPNHVIVYIDSLNQRKK